MARSIPPFRTHLALLEHDMAHGEPRPALGARAHWIRSWLIQKHRQWRRVDWLVSGSNPVLGALACAGLCRAGQRTLWAQPSESDLWDYPLAMGGSNDDLLKAAGLPPMGQSLFDHLAAECHGRLWVAKGWRIDYVHRPILPGSQALAFASPGADGAELGEMRILADKMAWRAFGKFPSLGALEKGRGGQGPRQQIIEHARMAMVSDSLDGAQRVSASPGMAAWAPAPHAGGPADPLRLGRSRWHAQTPLEFAAQSREDIKIALRHGGWT